MCTNGRFIRNQYINKSFFVKCGHCDACLMEKANKRMMRIYDEYAPYLLGFFVTLTYKRNACPYFRIEDYENRLNPLPLYRDCRLVRKFGGSHVVDEIDHLCDVYVDYSSCIGNDVCRDFNSKEMKTLAHRFHQIGVCYYPDAQKFVKRLKINLSRKGYDGYFKTYMCSEYGEDSLRPHFHLLVFVENISKIYFLLKSCVMSSWKMCDKARWQKGFQLAQDPTSYVSSYVNKPADFPPFLSDNFRPKHSFSPHLGFNCKSYSLASLLSAIDSGNMQYSREICQNNVRSVVNLPLPKYVINRYFPTFKGYSRFTDFEIYNLLQYPRWFSEVRQRCDLSDEDIIKITKMVSGAHYRFFPHLNDSDYALLHLKAWKAYRSTCYRLFMEDEKIPTIQKYDNLYELASGVVRSNLVEVLPTSFVINPNEFSSNVSRTNFLTSKFAEKIKRKKVKELLTNQVYVT